MSKNLYVIEEIGATFVTLTEEDAQRVITSERALGLHVTALGRAYVSDEDYDDYARAVDASPNAATEHPVFYRVEHGLYPTVWEPLCEQKCWRGEEDCRSF